MEPYARDAKLEDCIELAPNMCDTDKEEVRIASGGLSPLAGLQDSFSRSVRAWSIINNDKVVGMFGVSHFEYPIGSAWLLTDGSITSFSKKFLRGCREYIREMHRYYPALMNYIDERNLKTRKWLKVLGFKEDLPIPDFMGSGVTFITVRRIECVSPQ